MRSGPPTLGSLPALTWDDLAPTYAALEAVPLTPAALKPWLESWSRVRTLVWERWSVVKSAEDWDLRDEGAQRARRQFVDEVRTPAGGADQRLARRLLSVPAWEPGPEHAQFVRGLRFAEAIAGEDILALAAQVAALGEEHWTLAAGMTVRLDGQVLGGPDIDARLQNGNRGVREAIWRAQAEPWLARRGEVDTLVLDLLARRRELARWVGLPDYRAFAWRELGRFDYSPRDCLGLHEAVARHIVPLAAKRYEQRRRALEVETLRPWDLRIDPSAAEPLQPFKDANLFAAGLQAVLHHRDPELGGLFSRMWEGGYLDLGWRAGKRSGGVERPFPLTRIPFVSVCGGGNDIHVGTLVHEMGHAFHDHLTMQHQGFDWHLRHTDEFSELAALGLWWLTELLLARDRGGFYTAEEAAQNRLRLLEELAIQNVPRHTRIDAFHHWIHTAGPDVTPADMDAMWARLGARFEPWVDWTGLEAQQGLEWRRHWGLFTGPFYDCAYILANLGALQLWRDSDRDPESAWQRYRTALALGATRPLPDLYRSAGAALPIRTGAVREVTEFVAARLWQLTGQG